jgi:hypothetical protein
VKAAKEEDREDKGEWENKKEEYYELKKMRDIPINPYISFTDDGRGGIGSHHH